MNVKIDTDNTTYYQLDYFVHLSKDFKAQRTIKGSGFTFIIWGDHVYLARGNSSGTIGMSRISRVDKLEDN